MLATYETGEALKQAAEKRLGNVISDDQWIAMLNWSEPYSDADLKEIIDALRDPRDQRFGAECNRLGALISNHLEEAHRSDPTRRRLLEASGFRVRPLGDFWGWSWLYAHLPEREILTLRRVHKWIPDLEVQVDKPIGFDYQHPSVYQILYLWELFWKAVRTLASRFDKPAMEVVAGLFWPDHFPGWNLEPMFPQNGARRAQMLVTWPEATNLTVDRVRDAMQDRIFSLYRTDLDIQRGLMNYRDETRHYLVFVERLYGSRAPWKWKWQEYERLRLQVPATTRSIGSREQFAVETKRAMKAAAAVEEGRARREEILYEIGPRWAMDGSPLSRPVNAKG